MTTGGPSSGRRTGVRRGASPRAASFAALVVLAGSGACGGTTAGLSDAAATPVAAQAGRVELAVSPAAEQPLLLHPPGSAEAIALTVTLTGSDRLVVSFVPDEPAACAGPARAELSVTADDGPPSVGGLCASRSVPLPVGGLTAGVPALLRFAVTAGPGRPEGAGAGVLLLTAVGSFTHQVAVPVDVPTPRDDVAPPLAEDTAPAPGTSAGPAAGPAADDGPPVAADLPADATPPALSRPGQEAVPAASPRPEPATDPEPAVPTG